MSVALMYHALYRDGDASSIDVEDRPYALAEGDFVAQLDRIVALGAGSPAKGGACRSGENGRFRAPVLITFDDGHASACRIALPHLLERGLHAWFFVTSDFVGRRPGFCTATEVRALADAGMSIGAHGASHAFFDDLSRAGAVRELRESRERLRALGAGAVTSMSFPGGRFRRETLALAAEAGYELLFGSRTGTLEPSPATRRSSRESPRDPLPRVAIRRGLPIDEFERIVTADPVWFRRRRAVERVKHAARSVLGNRMYHGLYKSLS